MGLTVHVCLGPDGGMAGQDGVDVGEDGILVSIRLEVLAEPLVCQRLCPAHRGRQRV